MARPLRIQYSGAFYHVTSRGNERKPIFIIKSDRTSFLSYLKSAYLRYGAVIHVFCLMNNHYHLLIETPKGNLSQIMRHINGAYTTYFNLKHKRAGHLFQGRYKAILVDADAYAGELSRYIHLNPVRAGISKMPEGYTWSSYQCYIGKNKKPDWLRVDFILGYLDNNTLLAQEKYIAFVLTRIYEKYDSPLNKTFASTILGDENFIEKITEKYLKDKKSDRDIPAVRQIKKSVGISSIYQKVKFLMNDNGSLAKKTTILICHRFNGFPLKEIGGYFGISESGISLSSYRFAKIFKRDRKLREKIERIRNELDL